MDLDRFCQIRLEGIKLDFFRNGPGCRSKQDKTLKSYPELECDKIDVKTADEVFCRCLNGYENKTTLS